jgi:hypothetical protein
MKRIARSLYISGRLIRQVELSVLEMKVIQICIVTPRSRFHHVGVEISVGSISVLVRHFQSAPHRGTVGK